MPAAKSFYDVIIVGGSLSALATGALLARRGFRIAWIRHDERPLAYTYDGASLLRSSSALTFADAPAFRRLVAELALTPLLRRKASTPDPLYQVVLPEHRIDVRAGGESLMAELIREFPEIRRAMEEFYGGVGRATAELDALLGSDVIWPPGGFFERREAARASLGNRFARRTGTEDPLADFPAGHPFRTFVLAHARFAGALDPDVITPLQLLRAHGNGIRGASFFEGGRDALQRLFEEKIVQHGGEIRARDRVARIVVQRGRVRGVDLATTDERLGCAFAVSSLDSVSTLRLAEQPLPAFGGDEKRAMPRTPRYYRYVLNVVLRATGIPAGMAPRTFSVADRSRPLMEENLLSIERAMTDENNRIVLTVTALLPRAGVEEGNDYLHRQRERVLAALGGVVPFLDRNILVVDSPNDGLPVDDRARGTPLPMGERWRPGPEPMQIVEAPDPAGYLGVCAMSGRTEIKGLLLVNRQVVAGAGEEGEIMAALSAARIITRTDRTKERLRRELWSKVEA